MTGLRVPDVVVSTLAGLGAVVVVEALTTPFAAATARATLFDLNAVVGVVTSLLAAVAAAATAVAVHELRLAPRTASTPVRWLLVGGAPLVVLALLAVVGTLAWSQGVGPFLSAFGVQVVAVLLGAGAAVLTGSVLRSRAVSRTAAEPSAPAH